MDVINSLLRAARSGNLKRVLELVEDDLVDINASNNNGLTVLHSACKEGHTRIVEELLARGANVHAKTLKGNQPIHIASLAGHEPVVRVLLDNGTDVNAQSTSGFTSLYMAAQENHESIVRLLLERGADQNISTTDGFTPLAVSLQQNHENIAKILLSHEARGQVRFPGVTTTGRSLLHVAAKKNDCAAAALLLQNNISPDVTSKSNFTSLHVACHYGNEAVGKLLIDNQANVDFQAKQNITPLHVAARWNQLHMVNLLLDHGAKIDAQTKDHLTPLHCAARMGHDACVELLIKRGAPISAKTRSHLLPLHMAAQGNHLKSARILLNEEAPVDDVTIDHLTSLHVASHCGHVKVAKLLLDYKADPNLRAQNGFTSLHIACKKNHLEIVKLLLKYGASLKAVTESGLSCLHIASFMGCVEIVIYLLDHNADIEAQTVRGETPLILATRSNQLEVIDVLLRYGANANACDQNHQNALHLSARLGNAKIAKLLIDRGIDIDAPTKQMYTALHIASKENHENIVALLLEHGANISCATRNHEFFPLHLASKYGNDKIVELLLNYGAPVDARGKNDVTSLMVASHYDHPRVVELLLMFGASPHAIAKNGYTAIHIAAKGNRLDCCNILLQNDADPNVESKAGFCPLHLAAQEGKADMAALLLNNGAHVNCRAKNGITPLHLCAQEDHVNVAQLLVKFAAHLDAQTKNGFTPLHVACHFTRLRMIRFLLANGANVNLQAASGYTSLHQASQQGNSQIVDLLLKYNAKPDALTDNGHSALSIAENLGHVSVIDTLRIVTETVIKTTKTIITEEKFKIVAPETMQETFVSDSEDEADDTPAHQESVRFLTTDVMRSFNNTMAEDNYNTSQSNLAAERQRSQQSNGELASMAVEQQQAQLQGQGASVPPSSGVPRTTRIADEMSQDLQYLSREAPLDGGESTFGGAYSTLGGSQQQQQPVNTTAMSHQTTYSSTMTRTSTPGDDDYEQRQRLETPLENDYERTDFRIDGDDDATQVYDYNQQMHGTGGALAGSYGQTIATNNQQQLEQLAPDNVDLQRPLQQTGFLVSFMVDARGGAMRGCRHSGVRVIIPPNTAQQPMRITCRYLRRERLVHPPPLMEGEACASKIMEVGPAGAKFLGPVLIEVPHFASLRGKEREITILRSDSGEVWREHLADPDEQQAADAIIRSAELAELAEQQHQQDNDDQENQRPGSAIGHSSQRDGADGGGGGGDSTAAQQERRLTRIVTNEFPQYFAIISRIRQEVHAVGPDGSVVDSQVVPKVQAIFTDGALTKRIKIGLQKKNANAQDDLESKDNLNSEHQQTANGQASTEDASDRERARSPSTGRPGSAAAKRKSRFLACFGASHGSHDLLDQAAEASNEASEASTGGDSPRQRPLADEKPCERRHIIEDVSDSEADSSSLEARAVCKRGAPSASSRKRSVNNELVPDDYYIEPEPPLILNVRPKTYGKRMASSSAQTDQKLQVNGFLSTSATKSNKKRRGVNLLGTAKRRRNKTQMQIPFHEPTARQQQKSSQSKTTTRPKSVDVGASSSQPDSSLESQHAEELDTLMMSSLNDLTYGDQDDQDETGATSQKWRTCTIQTDSDSVTVQYVTIASMADGGAAAATTTTPATGQDDGYVSGSGELKKGHKSGGLFSPFCASAKHDDDDNELERVLAEKKSANLEDLSLQERQADLSSEQQKKQKKQKDKKQKKSKSATGGKLTPTVETSKLDVALEAKTPELEDLQQSAAGLSEEAHKQDEAPASKRSSLVADASQLTDQPESILSEEAATAAPANDESLISTATATSRSTSPTGKELKQRLKLEKQERAKKEKLERQKQKELEEANAKAEKARKKAEKEAKKKAEKADKLALKKSPSGSRAQSPDSASNAADDSKSSGATSTITRTIQSVKFAPSPSKSDAQDHQLEQAVDFEDSSELAPEVWSTDKTKQGLDTARKSPPSKLLDSMKFKVKLPKLSSGKSKAAPGSESLNAPQEQANDDDEGPSQQLISFSSGAETISTPKEPPTGDQVKVLKPILKQQSSSFEQDQSASEPAPVQGDRQHGKSLESIADELVREATEAAVRVVSGEQQVSSSATTTSESKKEAKRLKAELKEQKRLAREAEKAAKLAEEAAKRAEHEAKNVAAGARDEAERQAKIAKEEAERAIKQLQEDSQSSPKASAAPQESASELKKRLKEAELEAKKKAKEAKAERVAKEAKSKLKLEKRQKREVVEPSAPPAVELETSPSERVDDDSQKVKALQESQPAVSQEVPGEESAAQLETSTKDAAEESTLTEASSSKSKDKKKSKKQKRDSEAAAIEKSSISSADTQPPTETASKSSFLSRLFKSKPKVKKQKLQDESLEKLEVTTTAIAVSELEETLRNQQDEQQHQMIVSEMYPSDPNNADGEMILEVNVPEELMNEARKMQQTTSVDSSNHQFQPQEDSKATSNQIHSSIVTSTSSQQLAEPTDDQEATLVNLSQMVDDVNDADDDQATENVLSHHSNEDLAAAALGPPPPEMHRSEAQQLELAPRVDERLEGKDLQQETQSPTGMQAEQRQEPITSAAPLQLQDEKARKELEAKLDKEAKKLAKEEEKQRKRQEAEDKKKAEAEAKKHAKEEKERQKREAKEAKRLAELAKEEARREKLKKEQEAKLEKKRLQEEKKRLQEEKKKKNKKTSKSGEDLRASTSATAAANDEQQHPPTQVPSQEVEESSQQPTTITTTTVTSTTTTTGDDKTLDPNIGAEELDPSARVLMSTSSEVPINEETEVERTVEEVVADDGTITKTTKTIETKYVTMRQEEIRVAERRDMPAEEWERIQTERAAKSAGELELAPTLRSGQTAAETASPELDEIKATPSYFDPDQPPAEIKPETSAKKALKKRIKLNQKLIRRAYKLAKSESKRAKRNQRKAETEIAVCDEAARQARRELKRAVKEAKKAAKLAEKQHKKMDKMDKKLAKRAKKLEKRQKKIDKRLAKRAIKEAKRAEKEARKAAKSGGATAGPSGTSRSPSRGSKRSIKLEDIGEPVLRSSSRLSIVQNNPNVEWSEQQVGRPSDVVAAAQIESQQQAQITELQARQVVDDVQAGLHSEMDAAEEASAMRRELEAARAEDEDMMLDVVGIDDVHGEEVESSSLSPEINSRDQSEEKENVSEEVEANETAEASKTTPTGKSKKNKKKNKRQKSKEAAS